MTKPRYQLLIEAQHQADDPDGVRRLRLLLKRMLRSFGLKCVTVTPAEAEGVVAKRPGQKLTRGPSPADPPCSALRSEA